VLNVAASQIVLKKWGRSVRYHFLRKWSKTTCEGSISKFRSSPTRTFKNRIDTPSSCRDMTKNNFIFCCSEKYVHKKVGSQCEVPFLEEME